MCVREGRRGLFYGHQLPVRPAFLRFVPVRGFRVETSVAVFVLLFRTVLLFSLHHDDLG